MFRLSTPLLILVFAVLATTVFGEKATGQEESPAQLSSRAEALEKLKNFEPFVGEWFMDKFEVVGDGSPLGTDGEMLDRVMVVKLEIFNRVTVVEVVLDKSDGERFVVWREFIGWDPASATVAGRFFGIAPKQVWLAGTSEWTSEGDALIRKYKGTSDGISQSGVGTILLVDKDTLKVHYTEGMKDGKPLEEEPPKEYKRRKQPGE
jgi:hypothetical protein